MAKKKSKNHQKLTHDQDHQNRLEVAGIDAGKIGNGLLVALISEVVVATIERLFQKASTSTSGQDGDTVAGGDRTLLAQVLSGLQAHLKTVQQPIQQGLVDAVETTKSVTADMPTDAEQVKEFVQDKVPKTAQQPVSATKTVANVVVGELVDTAKTMVSTLSNPKSNKSDKADKSGKKKKKRKK